MSTLTEKLSILCCTSPIYKTR